VTFTYVVSVARGALFEVGVGGHVFLARRSGQRDYCEKQYGSVQVNALRRYTRTVFHFPLVKSHRVNSPTEVSEMKIAQKTPVYPSPSALPNR